MHDIMTAEGKTFANPGKGETVADRAYVLDLYAECWPPRRASAPAAPRPAPDQHGRRAQRATGDAQADVRCGRS
jgi:hypothetical protein